MQKLLLILVILVGLGLIGYTFLYYVNDPVEAPSEPPTDTTPTESTPDETSELDLSSWQRYEAPASSPVQFFFSHPTAVTVDQLEPTIYEIKFIGPESEPNTEITDGYYLSVQLISDRSLSEYVAEQNPLEPATERTFNSYEARRYATESALGSQVEHLTLDIEPTAEYLVDITKSVSGEEREEYQAEVDAIVDSFEFSAASEMDLDEPIVVNTPATEETVESAIDLRGQARGTWFFEASAPVVVVDWDGRIIGESYITAEGDWMTESFVPFSGTVSYELPADTVSTSGTVIFQKSNPSGLPENDDAYEVPVTLVPNTPASE